MINILQKDSPVLRKVAAEVVFSDIGSKKLSGILKKMSQALEEQDDGVAIAAPQVGESLRIFVVSRRAFEIIDAEKKGEEVEEKKKYVDKVFINPKITKVSKNKEMMDEGCLSVRYLYGKVLRSKKASIEALDEGGKKFTLGASGILAQIFQHEVDHLDGVLFTDEAVDLEEIPPEKLTEKIKEKNR